MNVSAIPATNSTTPPPNAAEPPPASTTKVDKAADGSTTTTTTTTQVITAVPEETKKGGDPGVDVKKDDPPPAVVEVVEVQETKVTEKPADDDPSVLGHLKEIKTLLRTLTDKPTDPVVEEALEPTNKPKRALVEEVSPTKEASSLEQPVDPVPKLQTTSSSSSEAQPKDADVVLIERPVETVTEDLPLTSVFKVITNPVTRKSSMVIMVPLPDAEEAEPTAMAPLSRKSTMTMPLPDADEAKASATAPLSRKSTMTVPLTDPEDTDNATTVPPSRKSTMKSARKPSVASTRKATFVLPEDTLPEGTLPEDTLPEDTLELPETPVPEVKHPHLAPLLMKILLKLGVSPTNAMAKLVKWGIYK